MSRHDPMMAGGSALPAQKDTCDLTPATRGAARAPEAETAIAAQVQDLLSTGQESAARDLFSQIVVRQQRRASRIAWHYLRDAAEADEAVQDAFIKAYTHISSFQRHLSFEVWLTRILINGCLDRQKARTRRSRWLLPAADAGQRDQHALEHATRPADLSPEAQLMAREWRDQLVAAVDGLPDRQRLVFMLCHYDERTTRDVAAITGLNESTVRVHLFRAIRKLRAAMEGRRHAR